jgi:hypothetical protein
MPLLCALTVLFLCCPAFCITEGYPGDHSVVQGGSVTLHISTSAPSYYLRVFREGATRELVHTIPADSLPAGQNYYQTGQGTRSSGCQWPVAYTLRIPETWKSGAYIVKICAPGDSGTVRMNYSSVYYFDNLFINEIFFIVTNKNPGRDTKILFCVADNTYQAYNGWGGGGYYDGKQSFISFRRPYGDFSGYCQGFHDWDKKFIRWAEQSGYTLDYCSELDLDRDPNAAWLGNYNVVIYNGHSEYWTQNELDCLVRFQENHGGRLLIFSGNSCWGRNQFSTDGSLLSQTGSFNQDASIGLHFNGNLKHWKKYTGYPTYYENPGVGEKCGFTVSLQGAGHWIFTGTGMAPGDIFGYASRVIGYEIDGRNYVYNAASHSMTTSGTPPNVTVLAGNRYNGREDKYTYASCNTCMILFPRGTRGGFTFNVGNINWAYGLHIPQWERDKYTYRIGVYVDTFDTDACIQRITKNLLDSCGLGFLDRTSIFRDRGKETACGIDMTVQPNPVAETAVLSLSGRQDQGAYRAWMYNASGKKVRHLGNLRQGRTVILEARDLPAGVYLLKARGSGRTLTRRVLIIR